MFRALPLIVACTALVGCVRDNPDARLDDATALDPREVAAMLKLDCSQRRDEVQQARDEAQSDFDRVANYKMAVKAYTVAAEKIEGAFSKEPDLLYAAEGDALRLRLQRCQAQAKALTDELRKFELAMQFKPKPEAEEAPKPVVAAAPAPVKAPEAVKPAKVSKKAAKKKAMLAKRKKLSRGHAVLADASH